MFVHKVYKNGNSLKICLPQLYCRELGITHRTHLQIHLTDQNQLLLTPLTDQAAKYAAAAQRGGNK